LIGCVGAVADDAALDADADDDLEALYSSVASFSSSCTARPSDAYNFFVLSFNRALVAINCAMLVKNSTRSFSNSTRSEMAVSGSYSLTIQ